MIKDIFTYITSEESSYKTNPIAVADGFEWHMPEHIRACTLYKDGKLLTGNADDKPVKNIILPILNISYRSEGFDVKDIYPYVDDPDNYYKSFLIRKFHDRWSLEEGMDTFIDEIIESYVDYGGTLVKDVKGARPEVIPLQKIAFCDQTDILSGPFGIKHQFSIDQLMEKKGIWNSDAIDEVIEQARAEKSVSQANDQKSKTTGKYIEVYEVHGMLPDSWLSKENVNDEETYNQQIHVVSFAYDEQNAKYGINLYKGKEKSGLFKILKRDKRFGTALGRSAIEELIEPQVWINYSMIQIKKMLDKAAIMLATTSDPTVKSKNNVNDLPQGSIMEGDIKPFVFPSVNLQAFENSVVEWEQQARVTGSATDPQLGIDPVSGTPLGTTQIITSQGLGIHEYRRGQIASFVEEIYRDWIIPKMMIEINKGQKFLSELSLEELQEVADAVVNYHVNKNIKDKILSGKTITNDKVDTLKNFIRDDFLKNGNKKFIEIFKNEMTDTPVDVYVNVAGKQKNLSAMVDKLSNIFRYIFANPQILQDPNAAKIFNDIYEWSGFSPITIKKVNAPIPSPMQPNAKMMPQTNG